MKSKLEIYALAVCFTAVVCLIISVGIAGYSIIRIIDPELTMTSYNYGKYQTNDQYWQSKRTCSKDEEKEKRPSDTELTNQRVEAFQVEIQNEKRASFQALIQSLIFIVVGATTLLIHWRLAKKARTDKA
jgi:hypothetical protein